MNLPKCLRQGCDQPVKRHDCKYCSLRCSGIVAQRRTKPHPCERCGKELKGNQPRHCSLACRRGTPAPPKACAECGKPLKGAQKLCCSRGCYRKYDRANRGGRGTTPMVYTERAMRLSEHLRRKDYTREQIDDLLERIR